MFRTPDIPEPEEKEFDEEKFEKLKTWLERKENGKIITSYTHGGYVLVISTALILALLIGGTFGAVFGVVLFRSITLLIIPPILVFFISLYLLSNEFSRVEIDPNREQILYEGAVNYGGEYRSIEYRGSIKVIEGVQLIRLKKLFTKSKPYIRFITRSGYMRVNYDPEEEDEFLDALENVGLIERKKLKSALDKNEPVKETDQYIAYYTKKFDRSEYFSMLKQKRQMKKDQKKIQQKIKRQKVLEKQKKHLNKKGSSVEPKEKEIKD